MIDISIHIEDIVNKIDNTIKGYYDSVTDTVGVCETKWARIGQIVKDSQDREYRVIEVSNDSFIKATPLIGSEPLNGVITLPTPIFKTGTKLATNSEWTLHSSDLTEKLPLIWLLEIISENGYGKGSSLERDSDLRLFFLDETDPSQYYTREHRKNVVQPMQNLMTEFLNTIKILQEYKEIENFRFKTFSRFGVEQENGVVKNILDANLSGLALEFTLSRYKINCKC